MTAAAASFVPPMSIASTVVASASPPAVDRSSVTSTSFTSTDGTHPWPGRGPEPSKRVRVRLGRRGWQTAVALAGRADAADGEVPTT